MDIYDNLGNLPLSKSNPKLLESVFGNVDVVPMWIADMEFPIAKPIQDALIKRISNASFGYEYRPNSFFKALQNWYESHYNCIFEESHVLFSPSILATITTVIENCSLINDGIIIQPPVFMEFKDAIKSTQRAIVKNPLKLIEGSYQIDYEDLENKAKIETNKILILCNPHNPIGRVWTEKEIKRIISICKKHSVLLVSDEIHKDIILYDNKFTSTLEFQSSFDNILTCTSEAKSFNLCGFSDSMVIISNPDIRTLISKVFKKYGFGRTNVLTRVALEAAYKNGQEWLDSVIRQIELNVNTVEQIIADSKIKLIKPEGTYQLWLDFKAIFKDSKQMFSYITEKSGVALNAGHWFGREGALFMRMNIGTSTAKVKNSMEKIVNVCKN